MLTRLSFWVLASLLTSGALRPEIALGQSDDYLRAQTFVRDHQWKEGLALLGPLLQRDPRNTRALNLAGLALIGEGKVDQAEESFTKALTIDPRFVPALKNLSVAEFNSGHYTSAEKHLLVAQKIDPGDPAIDLYLGEIAFFDRNYPQAIARLSGLHEYLANRPAASAHLAMSYLRTGDSAKATAILDALAWDQIDPQTRFGLAVALGEAGLHERALAEFSALYARFPGSYDIGFNLMLEALAARKSPQAVQTGTDLIARGHDTAELEDVLAQAYESEADPRKAFEAYRRAISLNPQEEDNFVDLASLCLSQHALVAGNKVIQVGLITFPNSARLVFLRGIFHATEDDYESAEKDFNLSRTLSPSIDLGYIGLGASYLESGHSEQAIPILRERLRQKPNDPSLLYLLAESLLRSGASPGQAGYKEAQTDLEKSISLNPGLCLPHISLGVIYLNENRPQDAVVQLERARSIDPKEKSIYSHLAVAYKRLGQTEDAKTALLTLKNMLDQERQSAPERIKTPPTSSIEQQEDKANIQVTHP